MAYYYRLRDLKEDEDLTQKQVAQLISVSMNHYGKYERGETDIPFEKAIALAKHYHVSLDYLAGLTNRKTADAADLTDEQLAVAETYSRLSEKNRGKLELFAEMLLEKQQGK